MCFPEHKAPFTRGKTACICIVSRAYSPIIYTRPDPQKLTPQTITGPKVDSSDVSVANGRQGLFFKYNFKMSIQ